MNPALVVIKEMKLRRASSCMPCGGHESSVIFCADMSTQRGFGRELLHARRSGCQLGPTTAKVPLALNTRPVLPNKLVGTDTSNIAGIPHHPSLHSVPCQQPSTSRMHTFRYSTVPPQQSPTVIWRCSRSDERLLESKAGGNLDRLDIRAPSLEFQFVITPRCTILVRTSDSSPSSAASLLG